MLLRRLRLEVLDLVAEEDGEIPFIRVELTVAAHDTTEQPDVRSVVHGHYTSVTFDGMEQYLDRSSPGRPEAVEKRPCWL